MLLSALLTLLPADPWLVARPEAELGFFGVLAHDIQLGRSATDFDYVEDGGQDTLFPFARLKVALEIARRHTATFLYQPLEIVTELPLAAELVVEDLVFPAGTPMRLRYGFPFYRLSYDYALVDSAELRVAVGGSLQLRNATIEFRSLDGARGRSNRDVGPVPLLRATARLGLGASAYVAAEVDGIYAPISVLNGSDNEVVGALLDASLRAGVKLVAGAEAFVTVRYLGGGAKGQSDPEPFKDGYTRNWLHFLGVTLGASVDISAVD